MTNFVSWLNGIWYEDIAFILYVDVCLARCFTWLSDRTCISPVCWDLGTQGPAQ
jgi:hypothetical protein